MHHPARVGGGGPVVVGVVAEGGDDDLLGDLKVGGPPQRCPCLPRASDRPLGAAAAGAPITLAADAPAPAEHSKERALAVRLHSDAALSPVLVLDRRSVSSLQRRPGRPGPNASFRTFAEPNAKRPDAEADYQGIAPVQLVESPECHSNPAQVEDQADDRQCRCHLASFSAVFRRK